MTNPLLDIFNEITKPPEKSMYRPSFSDIAVFVLGCLLCFTTAGSCCYDCHLSHKEEMAKIEVEKAKAKAESLAPFVEVAKSMIGKVATDEKPLTEEEAVAITAYLRAIRNRPSPEGSPSSDPPAKRPLLDKLNDKVGDHE